MVKVGNVDLSLPNFNIVGTMTAVMWAFAILIFVGLAGWYIYSSYRNKVFWRTPVTLTWYMENGSKRTVYGLKGAKFINRSGVWDFKVKTPRQMRAKELGLVPDYSLADADGTLHFITAGDGTVWQQLKETIKTKELIFKDEKGKQQRMYEHSSIMDPVDTDVKQATVNSLKNWAEIVDKKKITIFSIGLGMFLIMVIAHLISLYIQAKLRCPA
jgi:hypothetical protein